MRALDGFDRVLEHWTWPVETRFYASEHSLAYTAADPGDEGDVGIATRDPQVIERLRPLMLETPDCWMSVKVGGRELSI